MVHSHDPSPPPPSFNPIQLIYPPPHLHSTPSTPPSPPQLLLPPLHCLSFSLLACTPTSLMDAPPHFSCKPHPAPPDDLMNGRDENNGEIESQDNCHRLIDQRPRTLIGDDDDFHHHHQPPQSAAPSSSSSTAPSSSSLPPTTHGSLEYIPTSPTRNSTADCAVNTSTTSTEADSGASDRGVPATRRRRKSNASTSDSLLLGLVVVLMVLFLGIFLISLKYLKFTYGWTLWVTDDNVRTIKRDASTANDVNGFPGPRVRIAGGILKGVLNSVLLKDSTTPPFMTPIIPGNVEQSQEKSGFHRSPLTLVRQWIQQVMIRFDEHRNRHKVP